MKKIQLIEWGIIAIALIFGFKFFESVFSSLVFIAYEWQDGYGEANRTIIFTLVPTIVYAVGFIVLIRQSRAIAIYLAGLAGNASNENIPLKLGKRSLLHVILIAICMASILSNIPSILIYLFETFKNEVGRRSLPVYDRTKVTEFAFKTAAVQVVASFVVLYFSHNISSWFIRKNEADELSFESKAENDQ